MGRCGQDRCVGERTAERCWRERFLVYLNKADVLESLDPAEKIVERCRMDRIEAVCGSLHKD